LKKFCKNILVYFFLAVFILPVGEKIIHDFSHADDIHCTVKGTLHFHATEHDCKLCDSESTQTERVTPLSIEDNSGTAPFLFSEFHEQSAHWGYFISLPARAPPVS
jgi:hypothetical protein